MIALTFIQPDYPPPALEMATRPPSDVIALIFHHSYGAGNQSVLAIDQEHRGEGWAMIGYHKIIDANGVIYNGRPDLDIPAAAEGMNEDSIDVCLLGDFEPGTFGFVPSVPAAQLNAAKQVALYYHQKFPTIKETIGHRDVSKLIDCPSDATLCPGDVLEAKLGEIKDYVASRLGK